MAVLRSHFRRRLINSSTNPGAVGVDHIDWRSGSSTKYVKTWRLSVIVDELVTPNCVLIVLLSTGVCNQKNWITIGVL